MAESQASAAARRPLHPRASQVLRGLVGIVLLAGCWLTGVSSVRAQFPTGEDLVEELSGTLAKVWRTGVFTIGYREGSFPFSYVNPRGTPVGYSIDLCKAIASEVGAELDGREIKIAYRLVAPSNRIAEVVNGNVDIECGSTTSSSLRRKEVEFSPTIFVTGTKLMVRRSSTYKSVRDLSDKTVVVTAGTTNEAAIRSLSQKWNLNIDLVTAPDHEQSFALLRAGKADAFATDDILLYGFLAETRTQREFRVVGDYLSYDPYGLMFRKDDPVFSALVQRTFEKLAQSRELVWTYDKWFVRPLPSGEILNVRIGPQLEEIFHTLGLPE
jgi:glutamate/aspartate transport system substrate-binding protein